MNWIKENKIRIIMIAVALLAVIGTVIVVTRRSGKAQTTDNNQSDVVINESSKEDVTTKKDDVIKESESTTEAEKEEETTSKDDKNVEEETTPAAAEPTTPYVAPTTKPQAKPTKPQAKPTTPQPTRPTEPATTAPVIHGKDGVILDTLYICKSDGSKIKFPESKKEIEDRLGKNHFYGIWYDDAAVKDILGIGLIMNQSTKEDVEAYFGKPLIEEKTVYDIFGAYKYKNSDLYVTFSYFLEGNHKMRLIIIDNTYK